MISDGAVVLVYALCHKDIEAIKTWHLGIEGPWEWQVFVWQL